MNRRTFLGRFLGAAAALAAGASIPLAAPKPAVAAISIPFKTLPMNKYIRGPRYYVVFDRIVTPEMHYHENRKETAAAVG
jgi:hypothetical protein